MVKGEKILAIAEEEIGYHEAKNKHNKYGEWYGMNYQAWCMIFVQWVYHQAGFDLPFKTASCGELLRWYKQNQPECVSGKPIKGCLCIFDFPNTNYSTDHVGLFVSKTNVLITTIDGNTSSASDANGGYVNMRTRTLSYANPVYIAPRGLIEDCDKVYEPRYSTLEEVERACPWATATVKKLIDKGALAGDGTGLDLSYDMLRMFVINDRMGVYE